MFSIGLLFSLIVIFFFNFKRVKTSPAWAFSFSVILIAFVLEVVSYSIILYQISFQNGFLYINQQLALDEIMKRQLFEKIYFAPDKHNSFYVPDAQLGYALGKGKRYSLYEANSQGLRAKREYAYFPDSKMFRVAVFGDSFVFCDGEKHENTWPHMLESSLGNLEVLNFGISGYGLVQSILRYFKDGLQFHPDVIIFNYIAMGPRDQFTYNYILDPRSSLGSSSLYRAIVYEKDGQLVSTAINAVDLFDKDKRQKYIYSLFDIKENDGFWGNKLFSVFNTGLLAKRNVLTRRYASLKTKDVSIDPGLNAKLIDLLLTTAFSHNTQVIFFSPVTYGQLNPALKAVLLKHKQNVYFIDAAKAFNLSLALTNMKDKQLWNSTNHYNAYGNLVYAKAVAGVLAERTWGLGQRQFNFNQQTKSFERIKK